MKDEEYARLKAFAAKCHLPGVVDAKVIVDAYVREPTYDEARAEVRVSRADFAYLRQRLDQESRL